MQRTNRTATWRGTLKSAATVAVLYLLGVLGWRTFVVPNFSGLRLGEPSLVRPVEIWRPGQRGLVFRYGSPKEDALVLAGDSRVQRGIVLSQFAANDVGPAYALTRPAAHTIDLLSIIDERLPGRAVICLSPLGLLNDEAQPLNEKPKAKPFPRRFDDWSSDWADMFRRRVAEPMIPPAWRYGWSGGTRQDKFFDAFKHSLRPETRDERLARLAEVQTFLSQLKSKGWHLVCVRIPTYAPMRAIEDEAFAPELFETMCQEIDVPYLDYGSGQYKTSDGSHLGVESAREFSGNLARALLSLPGMSPKR